MHDIQLDSWIRVDTQERIPAPEHGNGLFQALYFQQSLGPTVNFQMNGLLLKPDFFCVVKLVDPGNCLDT